MEWSPCLPQLGNLCSQFERSSSFWLEALLTCIVEHRCGTLYPNFSHLAQELLLPNEQICAAQKLMNLAQLDMLVSMGVWLVPAILAGLRPTSCMRRALLPVDLDVICLLRAMLIFL